jgi:hypothetical protein
MNFDDLELVTLFLFVVVPQYEVHGLSAQITLSRRFPNVVGALQAESAVAAGHEDGVRVSFEADIAEREGVIERLVFVVGAGVH